MMPPGSGCGHNLTLRIPTHKKLPNTKFFPLPKLNPLLTPHNVKELTQFSYICSTSYTHLNSTHPAHRGVRKGGKFLSNLTKTKKSTNTFSPMKSLLTTPTLPPNTPKSAADAPSPLLFFFQNYRPTTLRINLSIIALHLGLHQPV